MSRKIQEQFKDKVKTMNPKVVKMVIFKKNILLSEQKLYFKK